MTVRTRDMVYRTAYASLRGCSDDDEKRVASYVAATERGVDMGYMGVEVLRMQGARLARYRKNPVFLDSHNYDSAGAIIGSVKVKRVGRELHAEVEYAHTARASEIWQLVKEGHAKAVSIGYSFQQKDVRRIGKGEFDGEGESRVEGPASIVHTWELLELSQVSVPADEDAIRRSFYLQEQGMDYSQLPVGEAPAEKPDKPADVPATKAGKVIKAEFPEETRARLAEARKREVLARTPSRLREFAEGLLCDAGLSVDQICEQVLAEFKRTHKPVGSSEPEAPDAQPPVWNDRAKAAARALLTGEE